jgi:hypothetical protein
MFPRHSVRPVSCRMLLFDQRVTIIAVPGDSPASRNTFRPVDTSTAICRAPGSVGHGRIEPAWANTPHADIKPTRLRDLEGR